MSRAEQIKNLLSRNVVDVIDRAHLERRLLSGEKLRVKLGIDPTSPDLHLGHAVVLRKLREFQELGHKAVLIIGDFTARIGDPSGRDKTRPPLGEKEIKENMKKYLAQAEKIIDVKKAEVVYNGSWFSKEGVEQLLKLAAAGTFQQVSKRADFKKRVASGQDITFVELLYPLLQGYDSVKVLADVEIGGTDQTFNLLTGRHVQKHFDVPEQDIITTPLLEGIDGVRKMSKSLGNYIALDEKPDEMFGKVMSIPDKLVEKYFMLCANLGEKEIRGLREELGPKELKERLGFEIVKIYHGEKTARKTQENFEKLFSRREMSEEIPTNLPKLAISDKDKTVMELVMAAGVLKSKSEARRLIEQGGVEIDGEKKKNAAENLNLRGGEVVRIGKKRFFRIKI